MTLRQGCLRWSAVFALLAVGMLGFSAGASAETVTLEPGGAETFEVPAGVTSINVEAFGGAGQGIEACYAAGGSGALVTASLGVSQGNTLDAHFGGGGAGGSGDACGGGSGGGRAELLNGPEVLVVAGGGGGGGGRFDGSGGSAEAGEWTGGSGSAGPNPNASGEGGEGGGEHAPGNGGAASKIAGCTSGSAGSGVLGGGGGGVSEEEYCASGGGGGGAGYYGGGGGGGGVSVAGGGGGAGSSFVDPGVGKGEVAVNKANEKEKIVITYTLPPPLPECTMASGHGTVEKQGAPKHLGVIDNLSTNLAEPQRLVVNYEHNKPRYHLVALTQASCTGAAGEREFSGTGPARRNAKKGYTVEFSIREQNGRFYFESKVMKGEEVVEASGGPLKTKNQRIE